MSFLKFFIYYNICSFILFLFLFFIYKVFIKNIISNKIIDSIFKNNFDSVNNKSILDINVNSKEKESNNESKVPTFF